jgi:hypothetical protein
MKSVDHIKSIFKSTPSIIRQTLSPNLYTDWTPESKQAVLVYLTAGNTISQEEGMCVLNNLIEKYTYDDFYKYNSSNDKDYMDLLNNMITQCSVNNAFDGHYTRTPEESSKSLSTTAIIGIIIGCVIILLLIILLVKNN